MKAFLTDLLICPTCLPREVRLTLFAEEGIGEDVLTGRLECPRCRASYPIAAGTAFLLAQGLGKDNPEVQTKYETPELLSAYLWSHYADLLGDPSPAYAAWSSLLAPTEGIALDAGCAVGRFTFELAAKSTIAIGLDRSEAFIRTARELLTRGRLDFSLVEEGEICSARSLDLPPRWAGDRVEFIVGDAQALPFPSELFASTASLNLIDKLPRPLRHLQEMNRVARRAGAQFLFSDPFSWSGQAARREEWLGGRLSGPYAGRGYDNIPRILEGRGGPIVPPWTVERHGHIWWKIRNHSNHYELIRSWFVKATR